MWCCTNKAWIVDEQKTALQKVIELPSTTCTCPVSDKRHDEQTVWTVLTVGCLNWRDIEREKSVRRWSKVGRRRKKHNVEMGKSGNQMECYIHCWSPNIILMRIWSESGRSFIFDETFHLYVFLLFALWIISALSKCWICHLRGFASLVFFSLSLCVLCLCYSHQEDCNVCCDAIHSEHSMLPAPRITP